jgi:hypothetical protein
MYGGGCVVCGEDCEGFGEATPCRSMRVSNFTTYEDYALCNVSKVTGLDAINGNEQQTNSYWERIHEHGKLIHKDGKPITQVYVQHCFQTINIDCFNWSSFVAIVDSLDPSRNFFFEEKLMGMIKYLHLNTYCVHLRLT